MKAATLMGAMLLAGCASAPERPPPDIKRCAHALGVLHLGADCTALSPNICTITMDELGELQAAGAEKQIYCPPLDDGEESANQ